MTTRPDTEDSNPPRVPDPTLKPTLSIDEAADLLGVCRSTLYEAAKVGEIPVIKIGRRYLVPTAQLAQLLGIPADDQPVSGRSVPVGALLD